MAESASELLRFLVERYDTLKRNLVFKLGSTDLAEDALQDTYVKLSTTKGAAMAVSSPQSFLLRTAVNLAIDRIRADRRLMSEAEVDDFLQVPDRTADPAVSAAARMDLEAAARAMEALPPLRRQLLFASRIEGVPQKELARRYGISLRKVELEIHLAHEFCVQQMQWDSP